MNIARTIKAARERLKISQAELGRRIGVSKQAVAKWETGVTAPSRKNVADVALALGLSQTDVDYLSAVDIQPVDETTDKGSIPLMLLSDLSIQKFLKKHSTGTTYPVDAPKSIEPLDLVAVRVDTTDMEPHLYVNDVVILQRSIPPKTNDIVLAHVGGALVLRRYLDRGTDSSGAPCFDLVSFNNDVPTCTVNSQHPGSVLAVVIEHHRKRMRG
jgi:transcriptional regulator with XRE-family HTH domain